MAKKVKTPDKLSQDAAAARKLGLSYGQYKAMQKPTVIVKQPQTPPGIRKVCPNCGAVFFQTDRRKKIYCSRECTDLATHRARRERAKTHD